MVGRNLPRHHQQQGGERRDLEPQGPLALVRRRIYFLEIILLAGRREAPVAGPVPRLEADARLARRALPLARRGVARPAFAGLVGEPNANPRLLK